MPSLGLADRESAGLGRKKITNDPGSGESRNAAMAEYNRMMMTAALIEFTHPLWLLGGFAVLGPLFAHFWSRRAGRPVRFPSVELLIAAERQTSRRRAVSDAFLLALRCSAIALVTAAFAQPVLRGAPAPPPVLGASQAERTVAIVIDASASMQQRVGGTNALERAKSAAAAFTRSLAGRPARAAVVVAEAQPHPVWPAPTDRFAALAEAIGALQTQADPGGAGRAVLDDAARAARRALGGRADEVHVYTDGQASAWREPPSASVIIHAVVEESVPVNVALAGIRTEPAVPVIGRPTTLAVMLANHSAIPREAIVTVDGLAGVEPVTVRLNPGATGEGRVAFVPRTPEPTTITATVRTMGDVLAADNAQSHTFTPRSTVRVAVLGGSRELVSRAITPSERSPFDAVQIEADAIATGAADLYVLAMPVTLDTAGEKALLKNVEAGAGVLILGDLALAWPWAPAVPAAATGETARFAVASRPDDALQAFSGESLAALADVPLMRRGTVEAAPGARTLMALTDGTPGIVERAYGRGHVIAMPVTLAEPLTTSSVFVPLVHEMLHRLVPGSASETGPRIDPRESDLSQASWESGGPTDGALEQASATNAAQQDAGRPVSLWPWLIVTAGCLLVLECLVGGFVGARQRHPVGPEVSA